MCLYKRCITVRKNETIKKLLLNISQKNEINHLDEAIQNKSSYFLFVDRDTETIKECLDENTLAIDSSFGTVKYNGDEPYLCIKNNTNLLECAEDEVVDLQVIVLKNGEDIVVDNSKWIYEESSNFTHNKK